MPDIWRSIFMGTRPGSHRCWNLRKRLNIMYPLPCPAVALCMLHWIAIGRGTAWLGRISPGIHVGVALANHPAGPARGLAMPSGGCVDLLPTRMLRCWATNVLDGPTQWNLWGCVNLGAVPKLPGLSLHGGLFKWKSSLLVTELVMNIRWPLWVFPQLHPSTSSSSLHASWPPSLHASQPPRLLAPQSWTKKKQCGNIFCLGVFRL